ncbi:hypothetical protein Tco_0947256, partial [Tanacetum coccineum]
FIDDDQPSHVYKLKKTLYGLKHAPMTCGIETWSGACDRIGTPMDTKHKLDLDTIGTPARPTEKHLKEVIKTPSRVLSEELNS